MDHLSVNGRGWAPGTLTDVNTSFFEEFSHVTKYCSLKEKKIFFSIISLFLAHKLCKTTWQARVSHGPGLMSSALQLQPPECHLC